MKDKKDCKNTKNIEGKTDNQLREIGGITADNLDLTMNLYNMLE